MLDGSFLIRTGVSVCGNLDITDCDFKFETHYLLSELDELDPFDKHYEDMKKKPRVDSG